jgi:Protein kinase domain
VESLGWFESQSNIFIAMEYLEHGSLTEYINALFPESEVQDVVLQLSEGINFMHENGFAHRDLKPSVSSHVSGMGNHAKKQEYPCVQATSGVVGEDWRLWN